MPTKIQWTEETWNPVSGCRRKSPGCLNCYAERQAHRLAGNPNDKIALLYSGVTQITNGRPGWSGKTGFSESALLKPLHTRKPTTYFISLSDLFYDERRDSEIDYVFAVMALCQQHTFQVLTKYPERMLAWFDRLRVMAEKHRPNTVRKTFGESDALNLIWMHWRLGRGPAFPHGPWPLPNVWLGVSCEDQKHADERVPLLLKTPAAVRFASYEPALGPINFDEYIWPSCIATREEHDRDHGGGLWCDERSLDWIIYGSESGPAARPGNEEWARAVKNQCVEAGVPFFLKQFADAKGHKIGTPELDGQQWMQMPEAPCR